MISMPDPARSWEYENGFFLTCDASRLRKLIAHYELLKRVSDVPGAIVECGVFKGASFSRLAMFRELLGSPRKLIGFDIFGTFPSTNFEADQERRQQFIDEAGSESIGDEQLRDSLDDRGLGGDVELVAGDICATAAEYVTAHPALRISLLHIDVDVYEPTKAILEHLAPCVPRGGAILFDDYGSFPGETSAVDEYLSERPGWHLRVLPGIPAPSYVIVP